jgi:hypothetical protein
MHLLFIFWYFISLRYRNGNYMIVEYISHVARMGRREECTGVWWRNLRKRTHWGDPGVDGRMILRRIFRKWVVGLCNGLSWLRAETSGGHM